MSDLNISVTCTTPPQPWATVWYCNHCNALVSIQCVKAVDEAFCPACVEGPLEFCGRFSGIPGFQLGDA
jgi:uncharacterized paraquat-inducible protein A